MGIVKLIDVAVAMGTRHNPKHHKTIPIYNKKLRKICNRMEVFGALLPRRPSCKTNGNKIRVLDKKRMKIICCAPISLPTYFIIKSLRLSKTRLRTNHIIPKYLLSMLNLKIVFIIFLPFFYAVIIVVI